MELQSFITQAITDIINGVKDAQNQTAEGSVVPAGAGGDWEGIKLGVTHMQSVEFFVSVAVDDSMGKKSRIGVVSHFFKAETGNESQKANKHLTTLKFKIPVQFPTSGHINFGYEEPRIVE